jgi:hypothetical protein
MWLATASPTAESKANKTRIERGERLLKFLVANSSLIDILETRIYTVVSRAECLQASLRLGGVYFRLREVSDADVSGMRNVQLRGNTIRCVEYGYRACILNTGQCTER